MTYDEMILRGPEEWPEPVMMDECTACRGSGVMLDGDDEFTCTECLGDGEVEEIADEPDGDYLYERRRDAAMEKGNRE